jgi:hypothetical protein
MPTAEAPNLWAKHGGRAASCVRGQMTRPSDSGYDGVRAVGNAAHDKHHPRLLPLPGQPPP